MDEIQIIPVFREMRKVMRSAFQGILGRIGALESGGGPRALQDAGAISSRPRLARSVLECGSPLPLFRLATQSPMEERAAPTTFIVRLNVLVSLFVLCLTSGCFFGDAIPTPRTIVLSFPSPTGSLSASDVQVQDALRVIDRKLLAEQGLCRDPSPTNASESGFIGGYIPCGKGGLKYYDNPSLYFRNNQLEIVFSEIGWGRHLSEDTMKMYHSLKEELKGKYGAKMVRVK